MKKQILAIILVIVTVIGIIPLSSMSVYADSEIPEFNENDAEIYIDSAEDFIEFGKKIGERNTFEGKIIHIVNDIDLRNSNDGSMFDWKEIIGLNRTFSGIIDGHNHIVKGLLFENKTETGVNGLLCGNIKGTKTINNVYNTSAGVFNLAIIDSEIISDAKYNGALFGNISNGENVVIKNVYVDADITANDITVGGIIGNNSNSNSVIENCVFAGDININNKLSGLLYAGGIVGHNSSDTANLLIKNSALYGNINYVGTNDISGIGGFVGVNGKNTNASRVQVEKCISTFDFNIGAKKNDWGVCVGTSLNGTVPTVTNVLSTYQGAPDADKYTYVAPSELQGIDAQIPANSEFVTVPDGNPLPIGVVNLVRKIYLSDTENTLPTLFYGQQSTVLMADTKSTLRIIGGMNGELTDYDALGMEITMITENGKKWTNRKSDNTLPVITTVYDSVYGGGEEYHADTCDYLFVACVGGIKANVGELRFVVKTFHDKNNTRVYDDVYVITYDTTITVTE